MYLFILVGEPSSQVAACMTLVFLYGPYYTWTVEFDRFTNLSAIATELHTYC